MAAPNGTASEGRKASWQAWKIKHRDKINLKQNESRRANAEVYNAYERERKKQDPQRERVKRKRYAKARRAFLDSLKAYPCVDCQIQYPPYVMDFDHVNGEKKFNIAAKASGGDMQAILDEVAKCDLVCANCHRERTHNRGAL